MCIIKHNTNTKSSQQDNASDTEVINKIAMKFAFATVALSRSNI